jgi:hypothetical protein
MACPWALGIKATIFSGSVEELALIYNKVSIK